MRRFMLALSIVVAAATVVVVSPVQGAEPTGPHFRGTVRDESGAPIAGACVSARVRYDAQVVNTVCTDASGQYVTGDLTEGRTYYLEFRADGKVSAYAPGVPNMLSASAYLATAASPGTLDIVLRSTAGTLAGTLTDMIGGLVAYATVIVTGPVRAMVRTRNDGRYELPGLPVGDYKVQWVAGNGTQWARGQLTPEAAHLITVAAGQRVVVDDRLLMPTIPTQNGIVKGVVRDVASGAALAGASVTVILRNGLEEAGFAVTGADGRFTMRGLPAGAAYRIRINVPGRPEQWGMLAAELAAARTYYVEADPQEIELPTFAKAAEVTGQIRDPQGLPVQASLGFYGRVPSSGVPINLYAGVQTAADGTYRVVLPPGNWQVALAVTGLGQQWVPQVTTQEQAKVHVLAPGSATVVNERFAPRGVLEVIAVDETSGKPLPAACVTASGPAYGSGQRCDGNSAGVHRIEGVPAGEFYLDLTDATHLGRGLDRIQVTAGQTTRLTVRMRAAGRVVVPIARAAGDTARHCAWAAPVGLGQPWLMDNEVSVCTDGDTLTFEKVRTGKLNLFVLGGGDYGVQWLGAAGGTGDRREAAVIEVREGQTTTAPTARLDLAGAISGVVRATDPALAQDYVWVRPFGNGPGLVTSSSNLPSFTTSVQIGQTYRLDKLGPYAWPVEFFGDTVASTWSGGATNRFAAKYVKVTSGQTASLDVTVRPGARFTGIDLGGDPPEHWSVMAFDVVTGDVVGSAVYHAPDLRGLNTGRVFVAFDDYRTVEQFDCWYAGRLPGDAALSVTVGQVYPGLRLVPGTTCRPGTPMPAVATPRRSVEGEPTGPGPRRPQTPAPARSGTARR